MAEAATVSKLRELIEKDELTLAQIMEARRETYSSIERRHELARIVDGKDVDLEKKLGDNKGLSRKAAGQWILGRTKEALESFSHARPSKESLYVSALALIEANEGEKALEALDKLKGQDLPKED